MKKLLKIILDSYHFHSKIDFLNLFKLYFYEKSKTEKIITISLKGIKSPVYVRTGTSDIILIRNIFLDLEYPILKDYNPYIIIDAGANIGLASVYFKNHYPDAKIFAIEPEQTNCELFIKNTQTYFGIELLQGALLNESNLQTKISNKDDEHYAFRVENILTSVNPYENSIPSYSINQIIEMYKVNKIDILKMDIEGSEKDVFSSNLEWLDITDNIYIELHEMHREGL